MTTAQKNFIEKIAAVVKKYAPSYGIEVYSPIIAQAINESRWGKSSLAAKYHNYFGMKCGSAWTGKSVNLTTQEEYTAGTLTTIKDNFRVYDSLDEGVRGYFEFINTSRYANLKGVTDPETYLKNIKNDGYATSSSYVTNLMELITTYRLTDYDGASSGNSGNGTKSVDELAQEVIAGKWGSGAARKSALAAAGYDYSAVQAKVNELLGKSSASSSTSSTSATKKVTASDKAQKYSKSTAGTYKTTDNLYMRDGAGKNHDALIKIPKGTKVANYGYYSVADDGVKWLYIQVTLNGVKYTGFSCSTYLAK